EGLQRQVPCPLPQPVAVQVQPGADRGGVGDPDLGGGREGGGQQVCGLGIQPPQLDRAGGGAGREPHQRTAPDVLDRVEREHVGAGGQQLLQRGRVLDVEDLGGLRRLLGGVRVRGLPQQRGGQVAPDRVAEGEVVE